MQRDPEGLFWQAERRPPAQPGERDRPRRGDPAALPAPGVKNHGKDSGEKEGGSDIRAALPRGLRGYPHSDALHPIYVFRNAFLTCFFKKFQKIFRQMRDKYHYKAYVAFRMRENCTECRSDNSGSPIQYPIWPRPVSGRSYPPLPQKAASAWTRSHPRTSRSVISATIIYARPVQEPAV